MVRKAVTRIDEHEQPNDKSEPSKHLKNNPEYKQHHPYSKPPYSKLLKYATQVLDMLRFTFISSMTGYISRFLSFVKAIPKVDTYVKSLFARPAPGIISIIKTFSVIFE